MKGRPYEANVPRSIIVLAVIWRNWDEATTVLRHARVVTDPKKLAELHAAAARQKSRAEDSEVGTI